MRHNFHKETVRCWQNSYITFSAGRAIVIVVPGNLEVLFFLITYNIVQTALTNLDCLSSYGWLRFSSQRGATEQHVGGICKEASRCRTEHGLRKVTQVKLITSSSAGKQRAPLGYPSSQELLTFSCSSHSSLISRRQSGPPVNSSVPCFKIALRSKKNLWLHLSLFLVVLKK